MRAAPRVARARSVAHVARYRRHPWGTVTLAFWRKYPNKFSEHVKAIDTFERSFDPATGTLTTYRLITAETALPAWLAAVRASREPADAAKAGAHACSGA